MSKISCKIKDIKIDDNKLNLITDKGEYLIDIIKGSINCDIISIDTKKILPLSYLEIDDLIILKLLKNKIKKIYINLKYSFYTDSEDEDYL